MGEPEIKIGKIKKIDHIFELTARLFLPPQSENEEPLLIEFQGKKKKYDPLTLDSRLPASMAPFPPVCKRLAKVSNPRKYKLRRVYNSEGDLINPRSSDWKKPGKTSKNEFFEQKKLEREHLEKRKKVVKKLKTNFAGLHIKRFYMSPKQKYWFERDIKRIVFKRRRFDSQEALEQYWRRRMEKFYSKIYPPTIISKRNIRPPFTKRLSKTQKELIKKKKKELEDWLAEDNRRILNRNYSKSEPLLIHPLNFYRLYLDFRLRNIYKIPEISIFPQDKEEQRTLNWIKFMQEIQCGKYTYLFGKSRHTAVFCEENFKIQREYSIDVELKAKDFQSFFDPDWLVRFYLPRQHVIFYNRWTMDDWRRQNSPDEPFYLTCKSPLHQGIRAGWNALRITPIHDMSTPKMPNVVPALIRFLRDYKIPFEIYPCSIFQAVQPEANYSQSDMEKYEKWFVDKYVDFDLIKKESERIFMKFIRSSISLLFTGKNPMEGKAVFSQQWRDFVQPMKWVTHPEKGRMRFYVRKYYETSYSDSIPKKYMYMPYTLFKDFVKYTQFFLASMLVISLTAHEILPDMPPQARVIWEKMGKGGRNFSREISYYRPIKFKQARQERLFMPHSKRVFNAVLLDSPYTDKKLFDEFVKSIRSAAFNPETKNMKFHEFIQLPQIKLLIQPLMRNSSLNYSLVKLTPIPTDPVWNKTPFIRKLMRTFRVGINISFQQVNSLVKRFLNDSTQYNLEEVNLSDKTVWEVSQLCKKTGQHWLVLRNNLSLLDQAKYIYSPQTVRRFSQLFERRDIIFSAFPHYDRTSQDFYHACKKVSDLLFKKGKSFFNGNQTAAKFFNSPEIRSILRLPPHKDVSIFIYHKPSNRLVLQPNADEITVQQLYNISNLKNYYIHIVDPAAQHALNPPYNWVPKNLPITWTIQTRTLSLKAGNIYKKPELRLLAKPSENKIALRNFRLHYLKDLRFTDKEKSEFQSFLNQQFPGIDLSKFGDVLNYLKKPDKFWFNRKELSELLEKYRLFLRESRFVFPVIPTIKSAIKLCFSTPLMIPSEKLSGIKISPKKPLELSFSDPPSGNQTEEYAKYQAEKLMVCLPSLLITGAKVVKQIIKLSRLIYNNFQQRIDSESNPIFKSLLIQMQEKYVSGILIYFRWAWKRSVFGYFAREKKSSRKYFIYTSTDVEKPLAELEENPPISITFSETTKYAQQSVYQEAVKQYTDKFRRIFEAADKSLHFDKISSGPVPPADPLYSNLSSLKLDDNILNNFNSLLESSFSEGNRTSFIKELYGLPATADLDEEDKSAGGSEDEEDEESEVSKEEEELSLPEEFAYSESQQLEHEDYLLNNFLKYFSIQITTPVFKIPKDYYSLSELIAQIELFRLIWAVLYETFTKFPSKFCQFTHYSKFADYMRNFLDKVAKYQEFKERYPSVIQELKKLKIDIGTKFAELEKDYSSAVKVLLTKGREKTWEISPNIKSMYLDARNAQVACSEYYSQRAEACKKIITYISKFPVKILSKELNEQKINLLKKFNLFKENFLVLARSNAFVPPSFKEDDCLKDYNAKVDELDKWINNISLSSLDYAESLKLTLNIQGIQQLISQELALSAYTIVNFIKTPGTVGQSIKLSKLWKIWSIEARMIRALNKFKTPDENYFPAVSTHVYSGWKKLWLNRGFQSDLAPNNFSINLNFARRSIKSFSEASVDPLFNPGEAQNLIFSEWIQNHGISALNVLAKTPTVWYFDKDKKADKNKPLNQFPAMDLEKITFKSHDLKEVQRILKMHLQKPDDRKKWITNTIKEQSLDAHRKIRIIRFLQQIFNFSVDSPDDISAANVDLKKLLGLYLKFKVKLKKGLKIPEKPAEIERQADYYQNYTDNPDENFDKVNLIFSLMAEVILKGPSVGNKKINYFQVFAKYLLLPEELWPEYKNYSTVQRVPAADSSYFLIQVVEAKSGDGKPSEQKILRYYLLYIIPQIGPGIKRGDTRDFLLLCSPINPAKNRYYLEEEWEKFFDLDLPQVKKLVIDDQNIELRWFYFHQKNSGIPILLRMNKIQEISEKIKVLKPLIYPESGEIQASPIFWPVGTLENIDVFDQMDLNEEISKIPKNNFKNKFNYAKKSVAGAFEPFVTDGKNPAKKGKFENYSKIKNMVLERFGADLEETYSKALELNFEEAKNSVQFYKILKNLKEIKQIPEDGEKNPYSTPKAFQVEWSVHFTDLVKLRSLEKSSEIASFLIADPEAKKLLKQVNINRFSKIAENLNQIKGLVGFEESNDFNKSLLLEFWKNPIVEIQRFLRHFPGTEQDKQKPFLDYFIHLGDKYLKDYISIEDEGERNDWEFLVSSPAPIAQNNFKNSDKPWIFYNFLIKSYPKMLLGAVGSTDFSKGGKVFNKGNFLGFGFFATPLLQVKPDGDIRFYHPFQFLKTHIHPKMPGYISAGVDLGLRNPYEFQAYFLPKKTFLSPDEIKVKNSDGTVAKLREFTDKINSGAKILINRSNNHPQASQRYQRKKNRTLNRMHRVKPGAKTLKTARVLIKNSANITAIGNKSTRLNRSIGHYLARNIFRSLDSTVDYCVTDDGLKEAALNHIHGLWPHFNVGTFTEEQQNKLIKLHSRINFEDLRFFKASKNEKYALEKARWLRGTLPIYTGQMGKMKEVNVRRVPAAYTSKLSIEGAEGQKGFLLLKLKDSDEIYVLKAPPEPLKLEAYKAEIMKNINNADDYTYENSIPAKVKIEFEAKVGNDSKILFIPSGQGNAFVYDKTIVSDDGKTQSAVNFIVDRDVNGAYNIARYNKMKYLGETVNLQIDRFEKTGKFSGSSMDYRVTNLYKGLATLLETSLGVIHDGNELKPLDERRPWGVQEWFDWNELDVFDHEFILKTAKKGLIYNPVKKRGENITEIIHVLKEKAEESHFFESPDASCSFEAVKNTFQAVENFFTALSSDKSFKFKVKTKVWNNRWEKIKTAEFLTSEALGEETPESAEKTGTGTAADSQQEENKEGYDPPQAPNPE